MKAWLVRPNGSVRFLGKNDLLDIVSDPDDVYNEYRIKVLDASKEADEGYIFGYQATDRRKTAFLSGFLDLSRLFAGSRFALHAEFAERLESQ